ncbi:Coatomer gamma subunit [Spironucleus salmonicida]|nr:Coatomer gamma subunit [Spironucleus salmonicida]
MEQQRLELLRLLLALFDHKQPKISTKQYEQIFFAVIKILSSKNQQLLYVALQIISIITPIVPSAFFATRSLTTIYDKFVAIKPATLRLLGKVANSASIGDVQRLIKVSMASKNERLMTSAIIVAKQNNIIIDVDISKIFGPAGVIIGQMKSIDKLISISNLNYYCQFSVLQRSCEIIDERKRLIVILNMLPISAKDIYQEKYFVYAECLKQINQISFQTVKIQLQQVCQSFIMLFQHCRVDNQRVVVLREFSYFYALLPQQSEVFTISQHIIRTASTSANHIISVLALTSLIQVSPQIQDTIKLLSLLQFTTGYIKEKALLSLNMLSEKESTASIAVNISKLMIKSHDSSITNSGFKMIISMIQYANMFDQIVEILLEDIDLCSDQDINRQICEILGQTKTDQLKIASILLQRCLLGDQNLKQAAYQGLLFLFERSQPTDQFYSSVLKALNQVQIQSDLNDFITPSNTIEKFSVQDILYFQDDIISGNYDIVFGSIQFDIQDEKPTQQSKNLSTIENMIENNYSEIFTRGIFEPAASQTLDVSVQLCKVFLVIEQKQILKLLYKVVPDEGIICNNQQITIGKFQSRINQHMLHEINITYQTIDEIANFTNCKLKYDDADEDTEVIKLYDISITNYDLFQQIEVIEYQDKFEQLKDTTEEVVLHLEDIQDVYTAIENIPSFCGLMIIEVVYQTYKKAQFYMTGVLKNVGFIVCKVDIKLAKVGIKAKIHAVGPATQALYEMLE